MGIFGKLAFGFVCATTISTSAHAWDGVKTGKITRLDLTAGNNYGMRVFLNSSPAMCGASEDWAYMNTSWDNYQATAAIITSAWLANKPITIYSNKDSNSYCVIGYIVVN